MTNKAPVFGNTGRRAWIDARQGFFAPRNWPRSLLVQNPTLPNAATKPRLDEKLGPGWLEITNPTALYRKAVVRSREPLLFVISKGDTGGRK